LDVNVVVVDGDGNIVYTHHGSPFMTGHIAYYTHVKHVQLSEGVISEDRKLCMGGHLLYKTPPNLDMESLGAESVQQLWKSIYRFFKRFIPRDDNLYNTISQLQGQRQTDIGDLKNAKPILVDRLRAILNGFPHNECPQVVRDFLKSFVMKVIQSQVITCGAMLFTGHARERDIFAEAKNLDLDQLELETLQSIQSNWTTGTDRKCFLYDDCFQKKALAMILWLLYSSYANIPLTRDTLNNALVLLFRGNNGVGTFDPAILDYLLCLL
jgi:hypothetical protein